jgi:transcriptional regulator with XRE-family HTH domain
MAGTYITNLKELMHQKKITGTELAKRVGTNRRAIVCWRHGINRPHKNNLMLLQREFMDPKTGISQLYFHKNPHH